jgi:hypothetical protein
MFHICVYMHSRFVENQPTQILKDKLLIFKVVLSNSHFQANFSYGQ